MHYLPTEPRGRKVDDRPACGHVPRVAREYRDRTAARVAAAEVREFARRTLGVEPAPQRRKVKRRGPKRVRPECEHGPVRTLDAAEVHALGYELTRPVEPARYTRTVWDWRAGRRLSPGW